jgi:hypothetical protein
MDINEQLSAKGLRIEYLPIDQLKPYEKNNKKHGQKDLAATFASIKSFGFADVVIVDKDYEIIAGHGRLLAAKEAGETHVPTLVAFNLDKNQARAYRIAHNRTANIAKYNDDIMTEELASIQADGFELEDLKPLQLDKWIESIDIPEFDLETYEPKKTEELTKEDVPDCFFPSDNDWGIPVLSLKMMADYIDLPFYQWGDIAAKANKGTWHFYQEPEKFSRLWNDPTGPLRSPAVTIVEPNFELGPQTPKVVKAYFIYQKRWMARYWQENGKRIVVDIDAFPQDLELATMGVPKGWKSFATRGIKKFKDNLQYQYDYACKIACTDKILFLVYAGGKEIEKMCIDRGWHYIENRSAYDRAAWTELCQSQIDNKEVIKI